MSTAVLLLLPALNATASSFWPLLSKYDKAIFVELDVTDPKSWANIVQAAKDTFGNIDILVNNAGLADAIIGLLDIEEGLYISSDD